MATSTHNKYVSIPDWFSSSSSTLITSTEKPANITNVYYGGGGGGGTTGITEIPIDNKTIVWLDLVITVPIDNDKIIINTEGKITTSGTTGVWELRQLTDGTNYIYTTYPVVTQLGITMYAGTDGLDLGSIYDGLPIDNATIYWDLDENGNKILKAVGSSGGVADSVAWVNVTGKPDWLLDGKILYTEIEGIPDLSGFITKDYIDGKFVTFDLDETIDGIKTFTNGIKIGNSSINQSLNDVIYIDANLAVRGGITMYATGTVDIPSILDSLPVAGTESKGIASFDSSYFSVTNGKVTLLADNVGLNESELAEYLNTNNYAKKSDIPSLNDYAKQSWVESKGYALNSDLMLLTTKVDDFLEGSDTDTIINKWLELEAFLSGLSESDNLATILGNKADKSELTKYIPISGYTEVSGEKNFVGGLKVNGSPIYYDTEKKYWKLEGDLLVTGGVTMYGSDSSFTPSTIMDAIAVDGTTISKSGGVLKVIGGTGGGVADSVAWANITGKPTWIGSSKPSYSYSEITGAISTTELQNYLTSNSYLNVTSGDNRYLQLSGGTLRGGASISWGNANNGLTDTSDWNIKTDGLRILSSITSGSNAPSQYAAGLHVVGRYGFQIACEATSSNFYMRNIRDGVNNWCKLWHTGNDGSGSGLDADLLDNHHEEDFVRGFVNNVANLNTPFTTNRPYIWRYGSENSNIPAGASYYSNILHVGVNGADTAFDLLGSYYSNRLFFRTGTWSADGSGTIFTNAWKEIAFTDSNVASATKLQTARTIWGQSFDGTANVSGSITGLGSILGFNSIRNSSDVNQTNGIWVGNVFSSSLVYTDIAYNATKHLFFTGNVGIGTANPSYKLDVNGSIYSLGSSIFGNVFINGYGASGNKSGASIVINKGDDYFGIGPSSSNVSYMSLGTTSNSSGTWKSEFITIDRIGNVGIGTTTPSLKLHVEGGVRVNGQIIGVNSIVSNITNGYFVGNRNDGLGVTDGGLLLYTYGKTPISFYANGERMRIDASTGNVGIGTSSPVYKLDVNGVAKATSLYANSYVWLAPNSDAICINATAIAWHNSSNAWTDTLILFDRASITLNKNTTVQGNILATGGITMYSMRKLKNVVNERGLSLSELSAIKPTRYTWKDDRDNRLHFGGIADDIQQVLPEVVYKTSDGILTMDYGNAAFAVASSLIKPVIDHEKRIAILQKRIVELEEEVERLKAS